VHGNADPGARVYDGGFVSAMRGLLTAPMLLVLLACASPAPQSPDAAPPAAATLQPVGAVALQRTAPQDDALDLAVLVFDRGLDSAGASIFPEVRKAESLLLPVKLREVLVDSGYWGTVRVAESADVAVPVKLRGRILRADGATLELVITAIGADGRQLMQRNYRDEARESDYPVAAGTDPFNDIYHAISNDLAALTRDMDAREREHLRRLALLEFAERLAPRTFAGYVDVDRDGVRSLRSFPAEGDPMLARLQRLRRQDYLFIDTVDQQYRDLAQEIGPSYDLWRQYSLEVELYSEDYQATAGARPRAGRRGSFATLQQVYGSFRKVKLQEEDLQDLVAGFAGESLETVMEVDDGVVRLRGSVSERYAEWRQILARIYALESGGVTPP
jgi:hypothetical protein